ncbi:MAG: type II secretion system protein [bacterium]
MKHKNNSGFELIELLVVLAVIAMVAVCIVLVMVRINFSHGSGEKIGQVVKFSKQGFISDTWEGQLIRGGMNGGSGSFGTVPFDFTVEGEEMAKIVKQCMHDQTEVIVVYRIEGIYSAFRSESEGHFLATITPLKPDIKKNSGTPTR